MKFFSRLLALAGLLLAPALFAASAFEGYVTLTVDSGQEPPQALDYMIKGRLVRVHLEKAITSTVMNVDTREMIVLLHAQKRYFRITDPTKILPPSPGLKPGQIAGLDDTSKTEFILNYPCRQYLLKEKGNTTELWLTDGLGGFIGVGAGTVVLKDTWLAPIYCRSGCFPLRVVSRDDSGKELFRMEATSIRRTHIPDPLFLLPANYSQAQVAKPDGRIPPQPAAANTSKKN